MNQKRKENYLYFETFDTTNYINNDINKMKQKQT